MTVTQCIKFWQNYVQYPTKKSEHNSFSKAQFNVCFFFNFEDFILYVELIVLQSSFIRIKKKNAVFF
jgi:hypothetical protein